MSNCNLCPRRCNADRSTPAGLKRSLCRAGSDVQVALVSLHAWEEPCISGATGAGTIFFSHCNLRCTFCQNHEISREGKGIVVSPERLSEIFLEQQARGANCLELVTPTHYTDQIVWALTRAKAMGLTLPVVFNSNGYELPESLDRLRGLVDVFMPDLKYFDSRLGSRYSGVPHYFEHASRAIVRMHELVGAPRFDATGRMIGGMIIRHLVLPSHVEDSKRCLTWIHEMFSDAVYVSIMNQYTPLFGASRFPEINRPLMTLEYQKVIRHARQLGMNNVFIQKGKTCDSAFVPAFDGSWVEKAS